MATHSGERRGARPAAARAWARTAERRPVIDSLVARLRGSAP